MSIYSVATLGQPDNKVVFNDYQGSNGGSTSIIFRAQTRGASGFQIRQDDIPVPFESGVSDFNTLIGQVNYIIRGTMYPKDEESYDEGLYQLRKACSLDLQQTSDYNSDNGYVPYTWSDASGEKTLFVKALYVNIIESTRQGYVQPFTILCKVKDPIIYGATLKTASTAGSSPSTTTGAAKYSFKYPVVYGSTLYTVSSTASNNGNIPVYPVGITIYGPTTNPKILNSYTGEYLQVNVTLNSTSDLLNIQYNNSQLIATVNGNSVVSSITSDSTYFKIVPGDNPLTLSGSSVGTGAYMVVTYRDGYALA